MKQVKVSECFLSCTWLLLDSLKSSENGRRAILSDGVVQKVIEILESELRAKYEAQERREAFTAYKTAKPMNDERESRRKEYLEKAGIHQDWQSATESAFVD